MMAVRFLELFDCHAENVSVVSSMSPLSEITLLRYFGGRNCCFLLVTPNATGHSF